MSKVARPLFLVLALVIFAPTTASAAEAPPIVPLCALCHGEVGPSPFPGVPTIHGLPPGVLENAMFKYREGRRPCRKSECTEDGRCPDMSMCDIVAAMSDEEMDRLAHWYAAQPFANHQDPYDPELAAKGRALHDRYCEVCHTNYGSHPLDDASMLRGQRKVYLRNALGDFQQSRRSSGLEAMNARVRTFSDEELDALAEFYSGPAVYPLPGERLAGDRALDETLAAHPRPEE
jgi:cytochrome subunit of sulfide dehydrogenase